MREKLFYSSKIILFFFIIYKKRFFQIINTYICFSFKNTYINSLNLNLMVDKKIVFFFKLFDFSNRSNLSRIYPPFVANWHICYRASLSIRKTYAKPALGSCVRTLLIEHCSDRYIYGVLKNDNCGLQCDTQSW